MLESNISPVMTKIRVSCSTTNPLKEDGSLYINPKINCPLIRKTDSDERAPASQLMKQKNVGKGAALYRKPSRLINRCVSTLHRALSACNESGVRFC